MRAFSRKVGTYVWHAAVCGAVLALVISAFWAVSYSVSVHHRRKAERLLQQLAALPPGADFPTVQRIARVHGGVERCVGDLCSFDFDNSFVYYSPGLLRVQRRSEWDFFGLRPWRVSAHIETKGSELATMWVEAAVGRGQGWLYHEGPLSGGMWSWLEVSVMVDAGRFEQQLTMEKESDRKFVVGTGRQIEADSNGIIVTKPHLTTPGGGEALGVYLSPTAPSESRKAAFDLNLRCATTLVPCTEPCQFAPSAWHSYAQFIKSNGWALDESTNCPGGVVEKSP